jgi:high-affinity iron transporter
LGLPTRPPDFSAPDEVKSFTPQRVFSAATYGVPNTAMPAFDTGLDEQSRWDVAFYLLTLAHPGASPRGLELARAALVPTNYRDLAALSDEQLRARLAAAGLSQAQQEEALAALRAGPFSETIAAGAQGLSQARQEIQKAVARAHAGDRAGARRDLIGAYLDHFEPLEPALRARDPQLVTSIESAFLALRAAVESGKDIDSAAARLDSLLEKADTRGPRGGLIAFVAALAIVLREGVESALLVAALLALLRKAGRQHDANAVHAGWISALAAGAITWWGSGLILAHISGSHRELIEGVLQIVLAALIVYASHWLFAAMHSQRLISMFFQRSMAGAGAAIVLGITFIAVYREMFETVLFFRGLMLESAGAGGAVALGALTGLLALIALVALFQRVGRRLKARPLLITCGVLLCGMAVLMVGNGVRALQIQGALPLTVWGAFQIPALGIYATREGLVAQALVLVLLGASALWTTRRPGRRAKDEAAAPA